MIQQLVAQHDTVSEVVVSLHTISKRLPMQPPAKILLDSLHTQGSLLGIPVETRLSRGVSDANIFSHAGTPTLDTLGPIGMNLHTEQETVLVPSIFERAKLSFSIINALI